jgi:hypothetical protein
MATYHPPRLGEGERLSRPFATPGRDRPNEADLRAFMADRCIYNDLAKKYHLAAPPLLNRLMAWFNCATNLA